MTVRVRRFPATTGVTAVGGCGHEYRTRIKVSDGLARVVRTEASEHRFQDMKTRAIELLKTSDCPECRASGTLSDVRVNADSLTAQYHLEPLPPLTGSDRMVAFGESVRLQTWYEQIADTCQLVHSVMDYRLTLGLHLAIAAVHTVYPDTSHRAHGPSSPFPSAQQCCPRGQSDGNEPESFSIRLAEWLLVRHMTKTVQSMLYQTADAKEWIHFAKGGAGSSAYSPFKRDITGELLPAVLVASYHGWPDLASAEQAFDMLLTYSNPSTTGFLESLSGDPMPEAMDALAVFHALQPALTTTDPPF